VALFALSYALSWSWVIPLAEAHLVVRRGVGWPTHLPALLGPAIAAVVVTGWTMGRPGCVICWRGWPGGGFPFAGGWWQ